MHHIGNTNLAYKAEEIREQDEKKRLEVIKGKRDRQNEMKRKWMFRKIVNASTCSTFMLVIGVLGLIVYHHIELHEVTGEINRLNTEIRKLENENVHLASRLENTVSLHVIAEIAQNELGLQRLDKYQIEYVSLYKENTIELMHEAPRETFAARLNYSVHDMFRNAKEYIGAP